MHRDMDVIRQIVLSVRAAPSSIHGVEGIDRSVFAYHAQLLEEAGLVSASVQGSGKRIAEAAVIFRLTWAGEDFADSIVDDTLWNKAKQNIIKPSAAWTFGILVEYLRFEIKQKIGLP